MVVNRLGSLLPGTSTGPTDPSLDTIFAILRNERRRYTVHYLMQVGEPVPVSDLVEAVAAWETGKDRDEISNDERQRVHVSMLQSHLPAMADANLVTVDSEAGKVGITDRATEFDIYLEVVPEGDIDWGEYYLGVTLFNAVILALVWVDLYPFGTLPVGVWIVFVPAVFLLSALLHYWYQQKHQLGSGPIPVR